MEDDVGEFWAHDVKCVATIRDFLEMLGDQQPSFCENRSVNAVLTTWNHIAQGMKIQIDMDINPPQEIHATLLELDFLLGNFIQRGLNECVWIPREQRVFRVSVGQDKTNLLIDIEFSLVSVKPAAYLYNNIFARLRRDYEAGLAEAIVYEHGGKYKYEEKI